MLPRKMKAVIFLFLIPTLAFGEGLLIKTIDVDYSSSRGNLLKKASLGNAMSVTSFLNLESDLRSDENELKTEQARCELNLEMIDQRLASGDEELTEEGRRLVDKCEMILGYEW
jgi:hypothetical protein